MKISAFLLFCCFVNVFAAPTYSQATKISLHLKDASIEEVLNKIEDVSEFYFLYNNKLIDVTRKINIEADKEPIKDILNDILNKDTKFIVYDRQIILTPSEVTSLSAALQQLKITGTVTDEKGNPLPGVTVLVKGSTTGTLTDASGKYTIDNAPQNATLIFSFVGMATQEIPSDGQMLIDVVLKESAIGLEEVVVIGYGTQLKKDLTGSVASISEARLLDRPAFNVAQALSSKVAGVKVIERSGTPGGAPMIRIRGTNSINSGNEPLFVVDGVVGVTNAMTTLNPNEIQSIDVLKDASATAIYGARGSNGVIIITTKRGIVGKLEVEYNAYFQRGELTRHMNALTADEFLYVYEQAWANIEKYSKMGVIDRNKDFRGPTATGLSYSEMPWMFYKVNQGDYLLNLIGKDGNYYAPRFNTNWENTIIKSSNSMNHEVMVRGGNERAKFGTFLGYSNEQGILMGSFLKRYSGKINSDVKIFKWFDISANLTFSHSIENVKERGDNIRSIVEAFPMMPNKYPNDPDIYGSRAGNYSHNRDFPCGEMNIASPVSQLDNTDQINNVSQITGDIVLNFKITKDLTFKSNFGIDYYFKKYYFYIGKLINPYRGDVTMSGTQTEYWQNENYLNYEKQFGPHSITGLLGTSWSKYGWENYSISNSNFFDDFYKWHNIAMGTNAKPSISSSDGFNSLNSYFARVNYSYKSKYLLTLTSRIDGSSKFGANSKYGLFPSGSIAWRVSEEDFAKKIDALSNLKLRFSVGQTGNQEIGSYVTQQFLGSTSNIVFGDNSVSGLYQSSVGNPDLKWETTTQYDGGIDLGLFKDRITMNIDYYYKLTSDMLLNVPLPTSTTTGSVMKNYGSVENKGWEFTIGSHNIKGKNFNWYTNLTFSANKNKIIQLGLTGADIRLNSWIGGSATILRVGESIASYWGLTRLGTYSTEEASLAARYGLVPGDVKYEDKNKDGIIDFYSDGSIIGNAFPKWGMNINNSMTYKNFDFSLDIVISMGAKKMNKTIATGEDRQLASNGLNSILDAWRPDHQNTMVGQVRPSVGGGYQQWFPDTHWVQDASYMRGDGATLGYTLPTSMANKLRISKIRVYLNTKNFFLLTKYTGYDSEGNDLVQNNDSLTPGMDFYMYPRPTTYTAGINIIF